MREILHLQAGQCGNQIGSKVRPGSGLITGATVIGLWAAVWVKPAK